MSWKRWLTRRGRQVAAEEPAISVSTRALVDHYRTLFADGPVGEWTDCLDNLVGYGFKGVTGIYLHLDFREDGTGEFDAWRSVSTFVWRPVGERVIEVRLTDLFEHEDEGAGISPSLMTEEERANEPWHRVEYDFVAVSFSDGPLLFDVLPKNPPLDHPTASDLYGMGFLTPFTGPPGGPLKLAASPRHVRHPIPSWLTSRPAPKN